MDPRITGNLAMTFSKVCSGLNQNALRYLQPAWMDAVSGVFLRLIFAGAAFWLMGRLRRRPTASAGKSGSASAWACSSSTATCWGFCWR